jgi:predicted enzyme related to lactoylglutathione lyase
VYPGRTAASVDSGGVTDPPAPVLTVTMDAADPEALAPFWAAALGYRVAGAEGDYVALVPLAGGGPNVLLQQVPEPKSGKNRVHLDLKVPDIEAEAARLESLGARRTAGPVSELGSRWIVMADPEGNEFCVCDGQGGC